MQHTSSSLCSLPFVCLLGGFVSAEFRMCFNHKMPQIALHYCVGHSTAAAGKVNTLQRSAVPNKVRTNNLNPAEW